MNVSLPDPEMAGERDQPVALPATGTSLVLAHAPGAVHRPRPRLWLALMAVVLIMVPLLIYVMVAAATGSDLLDLWSDATNPGNRSAAVGGPAAGDLPPEVLPPSDPHALKDFSPTKAEEVNAAIPFGTRPVEYAVPFAGSQMPAASWANAVDCLTTAAYYEAVGEGTVGMRAVVQVVLNRVRHPAFPSSVCGVVFQGSERSTGCQFSFTCDGSLARKPNPIGWRAARGVALAALNGSVFAPVGLSTHFHTQWVVPVWATTLDKTAVIGHHIFYRWPGRWGTPAVLKTDYSVIEPDEPLMAGLQAAPDTALDDAASGGTADGPSFLTNDRQLIGNTPAEIHLRSPRSVPLRERWVIAPPSAAPAGPSTP